MSTTSADCVPSFIGIGSFRNIWDWYAKELRLERYEIGSTATMVALGGRMLQVGIATFR
jgi:hypothetical protein